MLRPSNLKIIVAAISLMNFLAPRVSYSANATYSAGSHEAMAYELINRERKQCGFSELSQDP